MLVRFVLIFALFLLPAITGCTPRNEARPVFEEHTRARIVVEDPADRDIEYRTTVITEEDDDGPGLFSLLGDIIAFPFRAVGWLIGGGD